MTTLDQPDIVFGVGGNIEVKGMLYSRARCINNCAYF